MNEKAIAAALEPLVSDLVALEKRFDALQLAPGPKGDPGVAPDPAVIAQQLAANDAFIERVKGAAGKDGAGIGAPQWEEGAVYREGTIVVANLGQHFKALRDTARSTDDGEHWQRVGSWGFRHRGAFDKEASYRDGDLFVDGYATFCIVRGKPVMLAGRGAIGEKGARGIPGDRGKDGRDGATIIGAQASGFKLVLVQKNADGSLDELEADFGPAFRELLKGAIAQAIPDIVEQLAIMREDIDDLVRLRGRAS